MASQARLRLVLALISTGISAVVAYGVWTWLRQPKTFVQGIEAGEGAEMENLVRDGVCVADPIVGYRPRKGVILHGFMGPLGGKDVAVTRHHNNLSLIRDGDLHGTLSGPRILVHGDSHMMGILSTADNATTLLEPMLRKIPGNEGALVLNAGCDNYCFYQYVLRNRSLAAELKPDVIVVVAYMGNDFVDLEDTRRPHLDDEGNEQGTSDNPPPETTSKRLAELDLNKPGPLGGLFWQGLNQAYYFGQRPERLPFIKKKAMRTLELLKVEAAASKADLVVVMLPSFTLAFPEKAQTAVPDKIKAVIKSGTQQAFYDWFRGELTEREVETIDLLPAIRKDGRQTLYANDMHLWIPGHRLLAEAMAATLKPILERRKK